MLKFILSWRTMVVMLIMIVGIVLLADEADHSIGVFIAEKASGILLVFGSGKLGEKWCDM